jgi:hypothetical protein
VSGEVLKFPALPGAGLTGPGTTVTLKCRAGYSEDRLSDRELDALSPVLPELVSELLVLMALEQDRES